MWSAVALKLDGRRDWAVVIWIERREEPSALWSSNVGGEDLSKEKRKGVVNAQRSARPNPNVPTCLVLRYTLHK